ncbi:MAG: hypothetical protein LKM30_01905 [Bacilli bacterium]|jgi:hypothetical protein|nr:hypothetical protein [Bacilli bacterium]
MKNTETALERSQERRLVDSESFRQMPRWATYFYYAPSRQDLSEMTSLLEEDSFKSISDPHEVAKDIYVAELMDGSGRQIVLRSC